MNGGDGAVRQDYREKLDHHLYVIIVAFCDHRVGSEANNNCAL